MKKSAKSAISRTELEAGRTVFTDKRIDPAAPRIGAIHPGAILREEFMQPLKLSAYRIAMDIHVPPGRISEIAQGRRDISPDTALRLAQYFDTSAGFWINLQGLYNLEIAKGVYGTRIRREVKPCKRPSLQGAA
jgi:addiction module HigA family antidote